MDKVLDEQRMAEVGRHVQVCQHCQEILQDYRTADEAAGAWVAAGKDDPSGPDCLDEETLAAFVDCALDESEVRAAETHLANCPRCIKAVSDLIKAARYCDEPR